MHCDIAVADRQPLVLTQMLAPSFGHEGFEIATGVLSIIEEAPHNRPIPATDWFEGAHRVLELGSVQWINPILYTDKHRASLERNPLITLRRLGPPPWLRVEALRAL